MLCAARNAANDARAVSGVNATTVVAAIVAAALARLLTGSNLEAAGLGLATLAVTYGVFFLVYLVLNLTGWNRLLAPNCRRLAPNAILFGVFPPNLDRWKAVPREGMACEVRDPHGQVSRAEHLGHTTNPTEAFTYPREFGLPVDAAPSGTYRAIWRKRTKRGKWQELFRYDAEISEESS